MPRISRYHLSQQEIGTLSDQFALLITSLQKKSQVQEFLQEFLTHEEKIMLTKRLFLFVLLAQNTPQESIQSTLHVSYETVRMYHQKFPFKTREFHIIIKQLLQKNQTKQLLKQFEKALHVLSLISSSKTNMRARQKILSIE